MKLNILGAKIEIRNLSSTAESILEKAGWIDTSVHSGVKISEETSLKFSAVFACNKILGQSVAQLPMNLYRRTDQGREVASDHPLQMLLKNQPNGIHTSYSFRQFMMNYYNLWGNCYARIIRKGGKIVELAPIPSSKVEPYMGNSGNLYYKITRPSGKSADTIPSRDMLHIYGVSLDGIKGMSPIKMSAESIGLGVAATEFGARFFGQGTVLSGVIEYPSAVSDKILKNLKDGFKKAFGGLEKSHGIPVLEQGAKFNPISMPLEDAQYLQTRKFQITDIARIFSVPPHMIGDLERSTNNNIEEQGIEFVSYTLAPIAVAWEQEMNKKLLTEKERENMFFKFSLSGLLRGDSAARSQLYKEGIWNGWLSQNDVRELEDLNKIDGGDQYWVSTNLVPLNKYDQFVNPRNALDNKIEK